MDLHFIQKPEHATTNVNKDDKRTRISINWQQKINQGSIISAM